MHKVNEEIKVKGEYPTYANIGGYPLFYFADTTGEIYCPDCANKNQDEVTHYDINWENAELYCGICSTNIESAYGEDK